MSHELWHRPRTKDYVKKQFCQRYREEHAVFLASIKGLDAQDDSSHYASLLMRRLMIAYFLQHAGLLDGSSNYLTEHLSEIQKEKGRDAFFRHFLLPFFHKGIGQHHHSPLPHPLFGELAAFSHSIFMPHNLEQTGQHVSIIDSAFERLFTFLDEYQWRLWESNEHATCPERSLYPDILGTLFEQEINQKLMGAYYTGEDVTMYIATNTIIPCLLEKVWRRRADAYRPGLSLGELVQQNPDRYIHEELRCSERLPTETDREYAQRKTRYQELFTLLKRGGVQRIEDLITCNLDLYRVVQDMIASCQQSDELYLLYSELERITILDPTCGTGEFLLAAFDVLAFLYTTLFSRIESILATRTLSDECRDTPTLVKLQAIANGAKQHCHTEDFILSTILSRNLYGVDVMEEAVQLCQLRLLFVALGYTKNKTAMELVHEVVAHMRTGNTLLGAVSHRHGIEQEDVLQRAFHWFQEFHDVMERGGFDVVIGNPPFIEYDKVKRIYQAKGTKDFQAESCGNLYALALERSLTLWCAPGGYLGMIVPLSLCGSQRFTGLRAMLKEQTGSLWLASFDIFPSRLFRGAFQRLSLLIARPSTLGQQEIAVTRIIRWYGQERAQLVHLLAYTPLQQQLDPYRAHVFPRLASTLHEGIIYKLEAKGEGKPLAHLLQAYQTPYFVYYQEATNYWTKAACRVPFYKKNGMTSAPAHGRFLYFAEEQQARAVMAMLNSSLFYLWFVTFSDGFHLAHALVKTFPVGEGLHTFHALSTLSWQLEQDIQRHVQLSTRNTRADSRVLLRRGGDAIEIEEYRMASSKPLLDEIDHVLADYYGLTGEELDFVIHHDSKYRMGRAYLER